MRKDPRASGPGPLWRVRRRLQQGDVRRHHLVVAGDPSRARGAPAPRARRRRRSQRSRRSPVSWAGSGAPAAGRAGARRRGPDRSPPEEVAGPLVTHVSRPALGLVRAFGRSPGRVPCWPMRPRPGTRSPAVSTPRPAPAAPPLPPQGRGVLNACLGRRIGLPMLRPRAAPVSPQQFNIARPEALRELPPRSSRRDRPQVDTAPARPPHDLHHAGPASTTSGKTSSSCARQQLPRPGGRGRPPPAAPSAFSRCSQSLSVSRSHAAAYAPPPCRPAPSSTSADARRPPRLRELPARRASRGGSRRRLTSIA